MTIKEYLQEYFTKTEVLSNDGIEVWTTQVLSKGVVTVEYNPVTDRVSIMHQTRDNRNDFYEAINGKEFKNTVEYCLGPVVSEKQWQSNKLIDADSDLDELEEF